MTIRWECKCVWRLPLLCLERETFGETICSHLKSPLPKPCSKFQILPVKQSTPFPSVSFIQKLHTLQDQDFVSLPSSNSFPKFKPPPSFTPPKTKSTLSAACTKFQLAFLSPNTKFQCIVCWHYSLKVSSKTAYDDVKQAHDKVLGKFVVCVFVWISRRAPEAKSNPSRKTIIPQSRADFECWWEIQLLTRP